jgi:arginine-tRNA-protein transferase
MKKSDETIREDITEFCTLDYPCAYLPGRTVRMYYRYTENADFDFCSTLIERGWRRFGNYYFYPVCNGCDSCKSLRICVDTFEMTKSRKKALRRNRDTKIMIRTPTVTTDHLELYNRYHRWKSEKDGWKYREIGFREYYENFAEGAHDFGKEVLYFIDDRLVGVDLVDLVKDGLSSVYFFHDPDYAWYSLGTFSLLKQIDFARELGLEYIYLGYWVDGCRAFAYKSTFKPLEILDGFPPLDETPLWREFRDGSSI